MVPTHKGDTKRSREYWGLGEYQHFVFVSTILPNFLSSPGGFHSAKCTMTGITSSYDSYSW